MSSGRRTCNDRVGKRADGAGPWPANGSRRRRRRFEFGSSAAGLGACLRSSACVCNSPRRGGPMAARSVSFRRSMSRRIGCRRFARPLHRRMRLPSPVPYSSRAAMGPAVGTRGLNVRGFVSEARGGCASPWQPLEPDGSLDLDSNQEPAVRSLPARRCLRPIGRSRFRASVVAAPRSNSCTRRTIGTCPSALTLLWRNRKQGR
jgi:hypothetical protein